MRTMRRAALAAALGCLCFVISAAFDPFYPKAAASLGFIGFLAAEAGAAVAKVRDPLAVVAIVAGAWFALRLWPPALAGAMYGITVASANRTWWLAVGADWQFVVGAGIAVAASAADVAFLLGACGAAIAALLNRIISPSRLR